MTDIVRVKGRPGHLEYVEAADGRRVLMSFRNRYSIETAAWEVMWVVVKKSEKRIVAIDFGTDFVAAQELYVKVCRAGRKLATLRCKNQGFEPPERYRDKMASLNRRGVWWCPYCMKLRRFEKRAWSESWHTPDEIEPSEPAYYCPMCDIPHGDWSVRRWNPLAARLYEGLTRRRSSGKRRRRKRAS